MLREKQMISGFSPDLERVSRESIFTTDSSILRTRALGYAIFRATLGILFIVTAILKFKAGVSTFADGLAKQFAGKLPEELVRLFGYILPFVEIISGTLMALGLFSFYGLALAGTLVLGLSFGKMLDGDAQTVAHNLSYAISIFLLFIFSEYNFYSLDRIRIARSARQ